MRNGIINKKLVTILIPFHNRKQLLIRALKSIKSIYSDINIIIGDNSSINYDSINTIAKQYNCIVLNLRQYEANLPLVYKIMLDYVNTPYVLVCDDDDILVNKKIHNSIINMLSNYVKHNIFPCVSFLSYDLNLKYSKNNIIVLNANDIKKYNIPKLWNGQFQTGLMYFPTKYLIQSINIWNNNNLERSFDLSHDECWALLSIQLANKYIHVSSIGMIPDRSVSESLNPYLSIFSCRSYIKDIAQILHKSIDWINIYESIQYKEISDIINKHINKNIIFNNNKLMQINKYIISCFSQKIPAYLIKKQLLSILEQYLKQFI